MDAKLIVSSRDLKGTSNARRMRRDGQIPGVIYSDGAAAREITVPAHEFELLLQHHAGDQMMVEIELDGKSESVLLKDVQREPLSGYPIHVDLQEVSMTKKLKIQVPVELVGDSEGVAAGGVLEHSLFSVGIGWLPGDIVETLEADVSTLQIGGQFFVKDITVDASKCTILTDGDIIVATVLAPRVSAAGAAEDGEGAAEPEVIGEKKKEGAE